MSKKQKFDSKAAKSTAGDKDEQRRLKEEARWVIASGNEAAQRALNTAVNGPKAG